MGRNIGLSRAWRPGFIDHACSTSERYDHIEDLERVPKPEGEACPPISDCEASCLGLGQSPTPRAQTGASTLVIYQAARGTREGGLLSPLLSVLALGGRGHGAEHGARLTVRLRRADFKWVPGRAKSGDLVPREDWDDCCGRGGPRRCGLAPWSGLPSGWGCPGLRREAAALSTGGPRRAGLGGSPCRSAEGERLVRPGLLRRGRGPGGGPDGLVRPGAGLDPRGCRRIAAEIPDWAVCCARHRIRTRAHPEGGGCESERLVASWPPARGAEPGTSWLRNCIQRGDGGPALGTPPWGTHNRCAGVGSPGARGC
ncbi:hypothetical protein NDU88_006139 [Pleurodeles waltl]|uniref:Uncharacterized protein n=1 Tax=Pleurodeles waltl TaxID=8319 RepID=A0AAV7QL33_PLEWA|nr:hypothetical protein NDU88_006139 [Pleurodeles waltl]